MNNIKIKLVTNVYSEMIDEHVELEMYTDKEQLVLCIDQSEFKTTMQVLQEMLNLMQSLQNVNKEV